MHTKLLLVIVLAGLHAMMWSTQRKWEKLGPDALLSRGLASGLHGGAGLLLIAILGLVFFGRAHG
jgi:hypothetical protein